MTKCWRDKSAVWIVGLILSIIAALLISVWVKFLPQEFWKPFTATLIVVIFGMVSFHQLPLKISHGFIYLAPAQFPSIGRKKIRLSGVKEILIDNCRKWDEKGKAGHTILMVRVIDLDGNKYRNIIFRQSVEEFKSALKSQGFDGLLKGHC